MNDVLGDSKKFAIVPLYELLEGSNIPILDGMDQIEVSACRRPYCELSRVHIHMSYVALKPGPLWKQLMLRGNGKPFPSHAIRKSRSQRTTTWPVIFG